MDDPRLTFPKEFSERDIISAILGMLIKRRAASNKYYLDKIGEIGKLEAQHAAQIADAKQDPAYGLGGFEDPIIKNYTDQHALLCKSRDEYAEWVRFWDACRTYVVQHLLDKAFPKGDF